VTRRVTDPWSLTMVVTARRRIQFASRRTRAAMLGKVAAIREACRCSGGGEGGGRGSVDSSFGRGERLWSLVGRDDVAG